MNKRICEHDKAVASGFARTDVTVQVLTTLSLLTLYTERDFEQKGVDSNRQVRVVVADGNHE